MKGCTPGVATSRRWSSRKPSGKADSRNTRQHETDDQVSTKVGAVQPGLGALTATHADRTLNHTILNQPGIRTVIVALGANDLLSGMSKESIEQELTELVHYDPTSATGIRNSRRTDGTPIRVILTTIPGLGLVDTDPREQRRRQLNTDLLAFYNTRYGANDVIDIAAAVGDPARPNQINPAYLTNGAPNHAYHNAVAQTVSDAVTRFPPDAQL